MTLVSGMLLGMGLFNHVLMSKMNARNETSSIESAFLLLSLRHYTFVSLFMAAVIWLSDKLFNPATSLLVRHSIFWLVFLTMITHFAFVAL